MIPHTINICIEYLERRAFLVYQTPVGQEHITVFLLFSALVNGGEWL